MEEERRATNGVLTRAWNVVKSYCCRSSSWLKKHEMLFVFVSGCVMTGFGIWLAFHLTGQAEQQALDTATKRRLFVAGIEADINLGTIQEIKKDMDIDDENIKKVWVNVRRLGSAAAVVALQDANLLSILSGEKVILFVAYMNHLSTFNQTLQEYQQIMQGCDFKNTDPVIRMRKLVLYNADGVRDIIAFLHTDLEECFDPNLYNPQNIEDMQERLTSLKSQYPKREEISAPNKE